MPHGPSPSLLAEIARLAAAAHDAAIYPAAAEPAAAGPTSGGTDPATRPQPTAADADAVMEYRHGCRDIARAYTRLADAADQLENHTGARLDVRDLIELHPDPPADPRGQRQAQQRAARRTGRDAEHLSWRDGARSRPAACPSPAELRSLLLATAAQLGRIDRAAHHDQTTGMQAAAGIAATREADQMLRSAQRRLRNAAGHRPPRAQPKPAPRCVNDPCPNPKRQRGAECDPCARHRQRHGTPRPISNDTP